MSKKSVNQTETGRSMVEMLGVLAIMALLSIVGILGLRSAMDKHRANTLIQEAQKRAVVVAGQIGFGQLVHLNDFHQNDFGYGTFDSGIYTPNGASWSNAGPQFAFKIMNADVKVCTQMKNMVESSEAICTISEDCSLIVFNNDLSSCVCTENETNENCQKCIAGIWTNICTAEQRCSNNTCVDVPEDYTQLEYLESTGTQYIDTLYSTGAGIKAELILEPLSNTASTALGVFGSNVTSGSANTETNRCQIILNSSLQMGFGIGNGYLSASKGPQLSLGNRYTVVVDVQQKITSVDGVSYNPNVEYTNPSQSKNIYLFWINGSIRDMTNMKLYACRIWDNNVLIRNFIPAKRNSDNELGMYDVVNKEFYVNQGSGDFIAGPEIGTLPNNNSP